MTSAQYVCGCTWSFGPFDLANDGSSPDASEADPYCANHPDQPAFTVSSFPYTPPDPNAAQGA